VRQSFNEPGSDDVRLVPRERSYDVENSHAPNHTTNALLSQGFSPTPRIHTPDLSPLRQITVRITHVNTRGPPRKKQKHRNQLTKARVCSTFTARDRGFRHPAERAESCGVRPWTRKVSPKTKSNTLPTSTLTRCQGGCYVFRVDTSFTQNVAAASPACVGPRGTGPRRGPSRPTSLAGVAHRKEVFSQ
jgi:hypothetical protein